MITFFQKNILFVFLIVVFWFFFFLSTVTSAQMGMPDVSTPQLELEPRYPQPGQPFTVRLGDYGGALGGVAPSWYVDGVLITEDTDATTIRLTAPPIGTPMTIEARVGDSADARRVWTSFTPSEIDIITESNTLAPYFYEGRRVPSQGSAVRLVAIPHLFDQKGMRVPDSQITYTWNVDNKKVVTDGNPVLYTTISDFGSPLVLLTANAPAYGVLYETVFYIETEAPSLQFYLLNPLTGLSRNAISDSYVRATDEVTVRAEPYGLASDVFQNGQYGWSINGSVVQNNDATPARITLQKQGGGGTSDVAFSIRNLSVLSQYAQNLFQLEF